MSVRTRQVVAGPEREDPERRRVAGLAEETLHHVVDRPVTARRHDPVHPVPHRPPCELLRIPAPRRLEDPPPSATFRETLPQRRLLVATPRPGVVNHHAAHSNRP